jgi:hypothetical protein
MRRVPLLASIVAAGLILGMHPSWVSGQSDKIPSISARQYTGGSAKVTVTGAVKFDQEVPINTQASVSDGEMTWLQFGASGSEEPNALITYQPSEVGITVGRGKFITTAGNTSGEKPKCPGTVEVTGSLITGHYTCPGATTYDAATGKIATVDIDIRFTAKS